MAHQHKSVMKTRVCLMLIMFILSFSSAIGQQFTTKGTKELGGCISYQRITPVFNGRNGETTTLYSIAPHLGIFIFNKFEIGVNPLELTILSSSGSTTTQAMIFAAPSYHFVVDEKAFPFIELLIGYSLQSENERYEDGFSWGWRTGVKFALLKNGLLNVSLRCLRVTINPDNAPNRNGYNQLFLSLGWTFWYE